MKILHITPSFFPATGYGGPTSSGYGLCNSLVDIPGIELKVITTDSDGPFGNRFPVRSFPLRMPAGYDVYYCRRWFGADIAPEQLWRLPSMILWADVVHLTAVYSPPTIPTLLVCKLLRKPVVWSLRGALQRWQGTSRTRTKKAWESICNILCDRSRVVFHLTSEEEASASIASLKRASSIVIPNGVDIPASSERAFRPGGRLRLLYLGRLHPIKGLENLLHALERLDEKVSLAICGNGDPIYEAQLKALTRDLSLNERVKFHGRISESERQNFFGNADACVIPSYSENFGMVVAESLAAGVPVVASTGTPWKRLDENGCGLWVQNSAEELATGIQCLLRLSLPDMGRKGRAWMQREFSWAGVGERMVSQYAELISRRNLARPTRN